ncbi:TIGR01906 family membrane protein [Ezakiella peruensis]|uniref:TIGR01906 family membrane protein n=1 Tax=Ezakiella peruensis TaxID=1464038 RepID=UPI0014735049|nr:TIGR01906 family membrane protein [Ezakiella peruensis]
MSKIFRIKTSKIILIIAISFMLLIAAIFYQGFNKRTYKKVYGQTNISENTGYSEEDYLKEVDNYKDYLLKSKDLALTSDNRYTENEILHMEDVRDIFKGAKTFALVTFVIAVIFILIMDKKNLMEFLKFSLIIPFAPAVLILPAIFNFDKFWTFFHKILFRNDLWLMDPNESLMINLLPGEIFNAIVIKVIISFLIAWLVFMGLIYILYLTRRVKNENK